MIRTLTEPIRVRANAKLTLSLRVLGTSPDGFHELDALTVSVSAPFDTLELVSAGRGNLVAVNTTGAVAFVPSDDSNLVARAARELFDHLGTRFDIHIQLHKDIPSAGGLGGGSADAAATLVALRSLLAPEVEITTGDLLAVAARLGSDVPFCVEGGAAWMRGRGEQLVPVEVRSPVTALIVVPPFRIATPDVYDAWDRLGGPTSPRTIPAPPAVAHLLAELGNDLEPAAERIEPRLEPVRADVERITGQAFLLAGSGSSLWTWFADPEAAEAARTRVERDLGLVAYVGVSVPQGVEPA